MSKAKRYNKGKLRYDLIPTNALEKVAEVYTKGSHKYSVYEDAKGNRIKGSDISFDELSNMDVSIVEDGANNWRLGQDWMSTIASVKRHIALWESGKDIDDDPAMGTYHLANATWGLLSLLEYYKIYPQGDDRPKPYLSHKKIGLDIDDVLADFVGAWLERYPQNKANFWNFDKDFGAKYESIKNDKEFWMNIKPKIDPSELLFEPTCYITSRGVPSEWTEEWLQRNGFPAVPVYTVGLGESKVEIAKSTGIDIFVDDRFENFVELNNAGICTFLMDADHNKRYDVQARRIYSLKDLM